MTHSHGYILLVEDDELTAELVEKYLTSHHFKVTTITNGEQLADTLQQQAITAVLLDILLPGKDGLYWLGWLKENYPTLPVLLCSRLTTAEERVNGLGLGAIDYISKPFHPREVLLRLKNVLATPQQFYPRIGPFSFDSRRALLLPSEPGAEPVSLTLQEVLLLQLFFQQPGKLITRDDIASWLHGGGHDPNKRGLDMLVTRLRKKLGDSGDMPRHLHTVWGKGYCFTPQT